MMCLQEAVSSRVSGPHGSLIVCCDAGFRELPAFQQWMELVVLAGDVFWVAALSFFFLEGWRKDYCFVPGLAVALNLAWDVLYIASGFVDTVGESIILTLFLFLDMAILRQYMSSGHQQLKWPPFFGQRFRWVALAGMAIACGGQWALYEFLRVFSFLTDPNLPMVCSGYMTNLVAILSFLFYYINFPKRKRNSFMGAGAMVIAITLISGANVALVLDKYKNLQNVYNLAPWLCWMLFLYIVTAVLAGVYFVAVARELPFLTTDEPAAES